jgi:hypothetical protein
MAVFFQLHRQLSSLIFLSPVLNYDISLLILSVVGSNSQQNKNIQLA